MDFVQLIYFFIINYEKIAMISFAPKRSPCPNPCVILIRKRAAVLNFLKHPAEHLYSFAIFMPY